MVKNLEYFLTMDGNIIIGDYEDECAPMMKITFFNEAVHLNDRDKEDIAGAAGLKLLKAFREKATAVKE